MVCRTASVERVAKTTKNAMDSIKDLESKIKKKASDYEDEFNSKINKNLKEAGITDANLMVLSTDTKVEYTSEFSIDGIANAVTSAIKAYGEAAGPGGKVTAESATSKDALDAYVDVVNQVAEAAKTSAKSAASFSFSMNRLGPGLFTFLSVISSTLQEKETFGEEAITATCFLYRMVESVEDIKRSTNFDNARIQAATYHAAAESDKELIICWKEMQQDLVKQVADGTLDPDAYLKKDAQYQEFVDSIMQRLKLCHFGAARTSMAKITPFTADTNYKVIDTPFKGSLADKDRETLLRIKSVRTTVDKATANALDTVAAKIEERLSSTVYGQSLLE